MSSILTVIKKNGFQGSKYPMHADNVYKLGSRVDCHLRFNINKNTSTKENYCTISLDKKGNAQLNTLSSCPVLLNDKEVKTPKKLKYGDTIKIGPKIFRWDLKRKEINSTSVTMSRSKTPSTAVKRASVSKGRRRRSLSDFRTNTIRTLRSSVGDRLNTWKESDEKMILSSTEVPSNDKVLVTNSPIKLSTTKERSPTKITGAKSVPRVASTNRTPKNTLIAKSLYLSKSTDGKKLPQKTNNLDSIKVLEKPSKIPRKFSETASLKKLQSPKVLPKTRSAKKSPQKTNVQAATSTFDVEVTQNYEQHVQTPKEKEFSLENVSQSKIVTPKSTCAKPETPNIKILKSANKKSASIKKSLSTKAIVQKRKFSSCADDAYLYPAKRMKLASFNSPDFTNATTDCFVDLGMEIQDAESPAMFDSSLFTSSPKRSSRIFNMSPDKSYNKVSSDHINSKENIAEFNSSTVSDVHNISGVKRILRTPKGDKTPTVVAGDKQLLATPKMQHSPVNDLSDLKNVKSPMKTSDRKQKEPKNDLTDVRGVKQLLGSAKKPKSPANDLTNIKGLKTLMKTPGRKQKSPKNDLTDVKGVKQIMKTPNITKKSPRNDLTDVQGVKRLLEPLPTTAKSPVNDLSRVAGVKALFSTPKIQKSPANNLADVKGVKQLMKTPGRKQKTPKNDLTQVAGVKQLFNSTPIVHSSPLNDLTDVKGVKNLFQSSARKQRTPKNDLTDVRGVKQLMNARKTPRNDLSDVDGVELLFSGRKSNNNDTVGGHNNSCNMDDLFDELKENDESSSTRKSLNNSFNKMLLKTPIRTYERKAKSMSPEKPAIKNVRIRNSLHPVQQNECSVQKWIEEHKSFTEKISALQKTPTEDTKSNNQKDLSTIENERLVDQNIITDSEELPADNLPAQKTRSKRQQIKKDLIVPVPVTRTRRGKANNITDTTQEQPTDSNEQKTDAVASTRTRRAKKTDKANSDIENETNVTEDVVVIKKTSRRLRGAGKKTLVSETIEILENNSPAQVDILTALGLNENDMKEKKTRKRTQKNDQIENEPPKRTRQKAKVVKFDLPQAETDIEEKKPTTRKRTKKNEQVEIEPPKRTRRNAKEVELEVPQTEATEPVHKTEQVEETTETKTKPTRGRKAKNNDCPVEPVRKSARTRKPKVY